MDSLFGVFRTILDNSLTLDNQLLRWFPVTLFVPSWDPLIPFPTGSSNASTSFVPSDLLRPYRVSNSRVCYINYSERTACMRKNGFPNTSNSIVLSRCQVSDYRTDQTQKGVIRLISIHSFN